MLTGNFLFNWAGLNGLLTIDSKNNLHQLVRRKFLEFCSRLFGFVSILVVVLSCPFSGDDSSHAAVFITLLSQTSYSEHPNFIQ